MTWHNRKRNKKKMIVKLQESNCRMIKSGKKINEKNIKKQSTSKTKWDRQNPQVVSCQTLNIKKYWIEGKNQIHKRIQNIKKQRKSVFNELNDDGWNFLKK